jgi:hypothetical protein
LFAITFFFVVVVVGSRLTSTTPFYLHPRYLLYLHPEYLGTEYFVLHKLSLGISK